MQRFTISLDDGLARDFDHLLARQGHANRSEAVRDLVRDALADAALADANTSEWCAATLSFVYDHHDQTVVRRVLALQHAHHDLVVSAMHTHLNHHDCLETVVLRGPTPAVRACCDALSALRGVRHGRAQFVPMAPAAMATPSRASTPPHHSHPHRRRTPPA